MASNNCPLCMGKLTNGEFLSCGYKLPDEEALSAVYNYDPSDYPQQQPEMREITPDVQMEEIYPNRPEPIFKVRDDEGKTVQGEYNAAQNTNAAANENPYASNGNPYADNGSFKPYINPNAQIPTPANTSNNSGSEFSEFMKKNWWLLLLSFFLPVIGLIIFLTDKNDLKNNKYKWLILAAVVAGFIIPP